jgi:hypothetical protein
MNRLGTWLWRGSSYPITLAALAFLCLGHGQGSCGEGEHEEAHHAHLAPSGAVCPASGALSCGAP